MSEEIEVVEDDGARHARELQITKIIVIGEYGDHSPYEETIHSNVLIGEGDGCTLNLTVVNAYVVKDED